MELVSIVIPVFNGEQYIEGCVRYVKAQTYKNLEVIFVNDGSTDKSGEACERATAGDDRFQVIHKENGGTARARNKGLENAHGRYITFFDVDDEYAPDMIEKMVSLMETESADMVVCGYYFKIENEYNGRNMTTYLEEKRYPYSVYRSFKDMKRDYIDIWDRDMFSNVWNKLYRMDKIRKHGMRFRDGHVYTEDRVFNRLFLSNDPSVAILDECLYYYVRERVGSTTEKYRDDAFQIRDKEYNEFKEHFRALGVWNKKAKEYTCREFVERIAGCIENVFHAQRNLTVREKYDRIKYMIGHPDVREAVMYAQCRSVKMRAFVLPVKWNWAFGAYAMGFLIYVIRSASPVLFHKLKSKR